MKPAELALYINQGGSIDQTFRFYFSATNLTAFAEVWNKNNTAKLMDLTTSWVNRNETGSWTKTYVFNGVTYTQTYTVRSILRVTATPATTAAVREDGVWDLFLLYPDNSRFYQMRGPAPLRVRSTRGPAL